MARIKDKKAANQQAPERNTKWKFYITVVIFLLSFISYFPALQNGFTNWDDDLYVTENPYIKELSAENIKGFFTRYQNANYHPITFLSLSLDYQVGGLDPFVFHLVNILFHSINSILVFWLLYLLFSNLRIATIAGILFGIHTLHVESVAWIAERKDVLYGFFFLSSLCVYSIYLTKDKKKFLFLSLFLFVLSALSKGQAVSLAVTVVLIDLLKGRKWNDKKVLLEKVPFFFIALVFGLIAINAQKSADAIFDNVASSFFDRILFASYGLVNYLLKMIFPFKLSALYPYPLKGNIGIEYWFSFIAVTGVIILWLRSFRKAPQVFFLFAFFLGNIFLVLQLIPVGNAIMADRYAYIPSVGVFALIGFGYDRWLSKLRAKKALLFLFISYCAFLAGLTFQRAQVWKDSFTLWSDTVKKYPTAEVAWNNLGSYHNNAGNYSEAIKNYDNAIKINPLYADAYSNRGMSKKNSGLYKEAIIDLEKSLEIKPNSAFAYSTKGVALTYLEDMNHALECFKKALQLDPNSGDAYSGIGRVKTHTGDVQGALQDFNKSLILRPNHPETLSNRGIAKAESGDMKGAISDFNEAIRLKPNYAGAYLNQGLVYLKVNQMDAACESFKKAGQLGSKQSQLLIQQYCGNK